MAERNQIVQRVLVCGSLIISGLSVAAETGFSSVKDFSHAVLIHEKVRIETITERNDGKKVTSNVKDCDVPKRCSEEEEERRIVGRRSEERWWRDNDGDWYEREELVRYDDSIEGEWDRLSREQYRKGASGYQDPPEGN